MHIESGENPRGVGIPEGRVQGANGGQKGVSFTSNLGLRWTIPVTAGGSQVSKREYSKGNIARGNTPCTVCS
jgi:hypothetical protein